jgi:hypothetical protein
MMSAKSSRRQKEESNSLLVLWTKYKPKTNDCLGLGCPTLFVLREGTRCPPLGQVSGSFDELSNQSITVYSVQLSNPDRALRPWTSHFPAGRVLSCLGQSDSDRPSESPSRPRQVRTPRQRTDFCPWENVTDVFPFAVLFANSAAAAFSVAHYSQEGIRQRHTAAVRFLSWE